MAKKVAKIKDEDNQSIDKLRDELFDYRVDIKSYRKNLNTLAVAGTILLSMLAFFGYNKIENIEETIMQRANERLALTDSLLAKIDQAKIDSLNQLLLSKEQEYNVTIANFERILRQSTDLQKKLLESLPENERTNGKTNSYSEEYPTSIFEINSFNKSLTKDQTEFLYLIFKDNIDFSRDDYISITLYPKGGRIILLDKNYKISSKLNKISYGIPPYENYKEYELQISFFKKEDNRYKRYWIKENVNLK